MKTCLHCKDPIRDFQKSSLGYHNDCLSILIDKCSESCDFEFIRQLYDHWRKITKQVKNAMPNFLPTILSINDIYGMIGRLATLRADCEDDKINGHITACIDELIWMIAWMQDAKA